MDSKFDYDKEIWSLKVKQENRRESVFQQMVLAVPQKFKHWVTKYPYLSSLHGCTQENWEAFVHIKICRHILEVASFIIAKGVNYPDNKPTDR